MVTQATAHMIAMRPAAALMVQEKPTETSRRSIINGNTTPPALVPLVLTPTVRACFLGNQRPMDMTPAAVDRK
jgi:hypothetical protein